MLVSTQDISPKGTRGIPKKKVLLGPLKGRGESTSSSSTR